MARKRIDETIRQQVVEAHASGLTMRRIAEDYGVSLSSVSRIIKETGLQKSRNEIIEKKGKTDRQKRIEDIERRIIELEKKVLEMEAKKKLKPDL